MDGLAQRETVQTGGRPRVVWRHARCVGARAREEREETPRDGETSLPLLPFLPSGDTHNDDGYWRSLEADAATLEPLEDAA